MKVEDALGLARGEFRKWGVMDWDVQLGRSMTLAGTTRWSRQVVTLARPLVELWDERLVLGVIRHELAHVLVGPFVSAHGAAWKAAAVRVGARPTYDVETGPEPVRGVVGRCGRGCVVERYRMPPSGLRLCETHHEKIVFARVA